jgi:hypothetical protein
MAESGGVTVGGGVDHAEHTATHRVPPQAEIHFPAMKVAAINLAPGDPVELIEP